MVSLDLGVTGEGERTSDGPTGAGCEFSFVHFGFSLALRCSTFCGCTPQQKAVRAVRLDFTFLSTNFTLSNLLTLQTKLTSRWSNSILRMT